MDEQLVATALLILAGQHVDVVLTGLLTWLMVWAGCAVLVGATTWAVNRR